MVHTEVGFLLHKCTSRHNTDMKQIPLDSSIDLGTVDIIQPEPQFKYKNSLMYKGIVSNLTKKENTDGGYLSTYGNTITTTENSIESNDYKTTITDPLLIQKIETYETADAILHARYVNGKLIVVLNSESGKSDFTLITVNDDGTETHNTYTALSSGNEKLNAYVLPNGQFCTKGGQYVQIWNIADDGTASYATDYFGNRYVTLPTSGEKFYCALVSDGVYIFGTDDVDLRKRSCKKVVIDWDNEPSFNEMDYGAEIIGFGCVSEEGLVTGEPVYVDGFYTPNWTHDDEGVKESDPYPENGYHDTAEYRESYTTFRFDYRKSFDDNADNGWRMSGDTLFIHSTLDNGVIQIQPFDPSKTATITTGWNEYGSPDTTTTPSTSYLTENSNISSSASSENDTETRNRNQYLYHSLLSISNNGTIRSKSLSAAMVVGFDLSLEGEARIYMLPAMTRVNSAMTGWDTSTRISFTDFDSPCGSLDKEVVDGTQVFPHLRFFENDTTKKGINWDYGRGWSRFIVDSIIVYNGGNKYGQAVLEEPLRLYNLDKTGLSHSTIDVLNGNVTNKFISNGDGYPRTTNSNNNNKVFDTETTWADLYNGQSNPYSYFFRNSNVYDKRARIHPITDAMKSASGSYYFSHNFTGINENSILSAVPFRAYETMTSGHLISVPVYNGLKTSICIDENIITTPTEMDENYSVNASGSNISIATWSSGTVTYCNIGKSGKITISKLSDFIFKTNIVSDRNLLVESRNGYLSLQTGFLGYAMDTVFDCEKAFDLKMPTDGQSYVSNDVYYFGSGINSGIKESLQTTSFLLPAITITGYCNPDDTSLFTKEILNNRKGLLRSRLIAYGVSIVPEDTNVQEFWTHTAATTDVLYKDSRYVHDNTVINTFEDEYKDTSWIPTDELIIYPVGMISRTYGENYVTATVDTGNNYVSRFYNKDNKTFVAFNQNDQVYYGSEIFTIQSGNYYFDKQGIYYLGSQTDYSQNIFTAYALGMEFLANSSSEAYFYSKWDKSIYVFTASNTVQKAFSLSDRPYVLDAVYSSNEQCLYILFEDGSLYIKSQIDDCIINDCNGVKLQTNENGAFVITENGFVIYNPYRYDYKEPLVIETEWLGDAVNVQKTSFVDVVLYSDEPKNTSIDITVSMIQNGVVTYDTKTFNVSKTDWRNQLVRVRYVPSKTNLVGNAVKVKVSGNDISVFSIAVEMNPTSDVPSVSRNLRG